MTAVFPDVGFIEVVENPGISQPWHVRLVDAGNHKRILWSENYAEEHTADAAIAWLGRLFSPVSVSRVDRSWLQVHLDDNLIAGGKIGVPIHRRRGTTAADHA